MASLKSFIKAVRAAKTLADERAVIQKESAAIRTSFREDFTDQALRRSNVAKLLYLFTLGERTHFGQVECLKLLASQKFSDKRLGYLGTMLLLDENQEVLTLVTNSLSNDLANPNQYVVSLALCTLANIASTEMARDLFADVEKIIGAANPYLRKTAALCAMRIVQRVPELDENFVDGAKLLIRDKNHGVLLCACALIQTMCDQNEEMIETLKPDVLPVVLTQLKALSSSGYAPEHDILGIADPFLQVKLLRLLRVFGTDDLAASEQMSDLLAQIASNTDSSKNAGNSVLYEVVLTIFAVKSESGLRVLGVNILGRFLTTKDNNIRYVALNTLLKVIESEPAAVQRHRATILECLQDSDISIRRRALELSYALVNEQNVRVLVRELLSFLERADAEFKANLVSQLAICAERFAPNKRWHIDTLLRALKLAGDSAKENVVSSFIALVMSAGAGGDPEQLRLYTVQKLYGALKADLSQQGLVLAGVWLLGEYGNILLKGGPFAIDDNSSVTVSESQLVDLMDSVLSSSASESVCEYAITALAKLSVRITSAAQIERVRTILDRWAKSVDIEAQQRVVEYVQLFVQPPAVRQGVLEKMPVPQVSNELSRRYQAEKDAKKKVKARPNASLAMSMDLLDLDGDESNGAPAAPVASSNDLLSDIFGTSQTQVQSQPKVATSANQNILDLFSSPASTTSPAQIPVQPPVHTAGLLVQESSPAPSADSTSSPSISAYQDDHVSLTFSAAREAPGIAAITARFTNVGSSSVTGLALQVAVPKSQRLQLQALSTATISPSESATQTLKVLGPAESAVRLRLRILYTADGQDFKQQLDFAGFSSIL